MMKKKAFITNALFFLFLTCWSISPVFSQQFTDELMTKLPKPYQYKILKAETFNKKGKAFLEKGGPVPDSLTLADSTLSKTEEKTIDEYYINRIKAAYCFRDANGLLYGVLDKFIKEFWKKFQGDKKPLEILIKIENAAYDSLIRADGLREKAEKELYLSDKVPLVSTAEVIENKALFRLEKVLYAYLNWPEQLNVAWLFSDDKSDPRIPSSEKEIQLSSIQLDLDSAKKDTVHKATSIYSLLHISENQVDNFNDFLKAKYPTKAENYLIDFQELNKNVIDSLHKKWQKYSFGEQLGSDTVQSKVFSNINITSNNAVTSEQSIVQSHNNVSTQTPSKQNATLSVPSGYQKSPKIEIPETRGFLYKVQISASRLRIPMQELRKIYPGQENITESFEDNWYKYTIGTFKFYHDARIFRDSIEVKGAFVIAYFNGKRIKISSEMTVSGN
jgi:hypothetical protein